MKLWTLLLIVAAVGCRTTGPNDNSVKGDGMGDLAAKLQKNAEAVKYALKSGLLTSMYAKEVCTCVFVTKIDHKTCIARANMYVTELAVTAEIDTTKKTVRGVGKKEDLKKLAAAYLPDVDPETLNPPFVAEFRADQPKLGCRIVTEPNPALTDGGVL